MAIKQYELMQKAAAYRTRMASPLKVAHLSENFSTTTRRKAFLCHSHQDVALVEGLLEILEEVGIDLYVDWKDNSMPDVPNEETARKIKDRIAGSHVFLFLATANAKKSSWCPWEIGCADIGKKSIYIIPTIDGGGDYGNEYLGLYPKIDVGLSNGVPTGFALFRPHSQTGTWLKDFVKGGSVL